MGAWSGGDAEGQLEVLGPLEGTPVGDTVGEAAYPSQAGTAHPGAQGMGAEAFGKREMVTTC